MLVESNQPRPDEVVWRPTSERRRFLFSQILGVSRIREVIGKKNSCSFLHLRPLYYVCT